MAKDPNRATRRMAAACLISVCGLGLGGPVVSAEEMTSIGFEAVPAGSKFQSSTIDFVGSVRVYDRLIVQRIEFPDGSIQVSATAGTSSSAWTISVPGNNDPEANGTRLLDAIDAIENPAAGSYLVELGPGTFHLGDRTLLMKPGLALEGSGQGRTRIVARGGATNARATVEIAEPASLSRLTVESEGSSYDNAVAVFIHSTSAELEDVTAIGRSASRLNYGIRIVGADVELDDVSASATGGAIAYGISIKDVDEAVLKAVRADVSGGGENYGIFVVNEQNLPEMKVVLDGVESEARGGTASHGLRLIGQAEVRISRSTLSASHALANLGASVFSLPPFTLRIDYSTLRAEGDDSYGLHSSVAAPGNAKGGSRHEPVITVDHSTISGEVHTIYDDVGMPIFVGGTRLDGGPVHALVGEIHCVAVYDEEYRSLDDACQD